MSDTCAACNRTFTSTSVTKTCGRCSKKYHFHCSKLTQVRDETNTLLKVCNECIADSNPSYARSRSASVSSINSGDQKIPRPSTPRSSTPTTVTISAEAWEAIKLKLDKLDKLDKIDSIATNLENIGKRFAAAESRLNVVESRITEAESASTTLRADQDAFVEKSKQQSNAFSLRQDTLQENLDSSPTNSGGPAGTDLKDRERLMVLEASYASLISHVQCLQYNNSVLAHSADLVIS